MLHFIFRKCRPSSRLYSFRHPGACRDPVLRSAKLALFCFITQVDTTYQLDTARPRYDDSTEYSPPIGGGDHGVVGRVSSHPSGPAKQISVSWVILGGGGPRSGGEGKNNKYPLHPAGSPPHRGGITHHASSRLYSFRHPGVSGPTAAQHATGG